MVKLNKIYTKTGDKGTTKLSDGKTVPKFDIRIKTYGTVDELNAHIGMSVHMANHDQKIAKLLHNICHDLFDLGADLSTPISADEQPEQALRIIPSQVTQLEKHIDFFNQDLPPLRSFVLPTGTKLASQLHICRTVTRRAETNVAELINQQPTTTNPESLKYLNRLSDLLFVLSRYDNISTNTGDTLWQPAKNR